MEAFTTFAQVPSLIFGVIMVFALGYMIYVVSSRKNRAREIAFLRSRLDEMQPSDPEYNQVRALYMSMMLTSLGSPAAFEAAGGFGSSDGGSGDTGTGHSGGSD